MQCANAQYLEYKWPIDVVRPLCLKLHYWCFHTRLSNFRYNDGENP